MLIFGHYPHGSHALLASDLHEWLSHDRQTTSSEGNPVALLQCSLVATPVALYALCTHAQLALETCQHMIHSDGILPLRQNNTQFHRDLTIY